jgi:hypothetical protein
MVGQKWSDHAVPVAGVFLLIASFLPWYGFGLPGSESVFEYTFSGWGLSGTWFLALTLALAAAGVWRPFRRDLGAVPGRIRLGLLGMVLAAIGLTLWEGQVLTQQAEVRRSALAEAIVDDNLRQVYATNQAAAQLEGTRWGYLAALVAMLLIAIGILTSGAAGGRRPAARGY